MTGSDRAEASSRDPRDLVPPSLSPRQEALLQSAFFDLLAHARAVPPHVLATRCHRGAAEVIAELDELDRIGRVGLDPNGAVTGALGLSVEPTPHHVDLDGAPPLHAWCVIDALGIMGALDACGALRTREPGSDAVIHLAFTDGVPSGDTGDLVVLVPPHSPGTPVRTTWCPSVSLFRSRAAAERWSETGNLEARVVDLGEASRSATRHWRDRLADDRPGTGR